MTTPQDGRPQPVVLSGLVALRKRLPGLLKRSGHPEVWGVKLSSDENDFPSTVILQKYLLANRDKSQPVDAAETQLLETLIWRKIMQPLKLLDKTSFDAKRFGGIGVVSIHEPEGGEGSKVVVTWNRLGATKDRQETFGNFDGFIRWRTALMELGMRHLGIHKATGALIEGAEDPYRMIQVNDYDGIHGFFFETCIVSSMMECRRVFHTTYPATLLQTYDVNLPSLVNFIWSGFIRPFAPPRCRQRFRPLWSKKSLTKTKYLRPIAATVGKEYGGQGGLTPRYGLKYATRSSLIFGRHASVIGTSSQHLAGPSTDSQVTIAASDVTSGTGGGASSTHTGASDYQLLTFAAATDLKIPLVVVHPPEQYEDILGPFDEPIRRLRRVPPIIFQTGAGAGDLDDPEPRAEQVEEEAPSSDDAPVATSELV